METTSYIMRMREIPHELFMNSCKMAADGQGEVLSGVDHVILVLSGKGGVGKSTVTTQLALGLVQAGKKVGILDVDLCGPSIPQMLGLRGCDVHQSSSGWVPVFADQEQRLGVMSIGFLLQRQDDAVVWRGPKKTDTPPGTSDEHIATVEALRNINPDGAVVVTTPQAVSLSDVRREVTFCRKTRLPILGLVENMSGFICPHCSECSNIFSTGGGESLAEETKVPFLGRIPLDPRLAGCLESGRNFLEQHADTTANAALTDVVQKLMKRITES